MMTSKIGQALSPLQASSFSCIFSWQIWIVSNLFHALTNFLNNVHQTEFANATSVKKFGSLSHKQ